MTVMERENLFDLATEFRGGTVATATMQDSIVTRRFTFFDAVSSEIETTAIESNRDFYAVVLHRIADAAPRLIPADDLI